MNNAKIRGNIFLFVENYYLISKEVVHIIGNQMSS